MENHFDIISKRRAARDKLFAVLERRLSRINRALETKTLIEEAFRQKAANPDGGLALLGKGKPASTNGKLADMAVSGRQGCGQNPRRRRMGA